MSAPIASPFVTVDEDTLAREFETRLVESSTLAFRVAFSVLRQREDAEDVAQEAFAKAYRSFQQLRDRETVSRLARADDVADGPRSPAARIADASRVRCLVSDEIVEAGLTRLLSREASTGDVVVSRERARSSSGRPLMHCPRS